jgi:2-polyprenyl-3-methyl-5-hydroxy-6-metoxy-1,4-benzoquinol methylase
MRRPVALNRANILRQASSGPTTTLTTLTVSFHAVLGHAGVGHGTLHLDAGCGAGMAAALSASLGARVAGIDAAEGMLEIAR